MISIAKAIAVMVIGTALSSFGDEPSVTDVFVPAHDGYQTIRIPSIVAANSGALIAFAEGRQSNADQAENKIIAKRSTDAGRTWSSVQLLADDGENSLNNPTSVVDAKTGRIFLMYQRIPAHTSEGSHAIKTGFDGPMVYRNFLITSDDEGKTWSKPRDVTRTTKHPTVATTIASGPGIGIQLTRGVHKGRVIFPFNEGPYNKWNNFAVFSDDDGETWTVGKNAPDNMLGARSKVNEVQMVELEDGSVMLNSRQFAGAKCRKIAVSRDGGQSWSSIQDAPELRDPSCMASILRFRFSTQDKPGVIIYSGPNSKMRDNGTLLISNDDGQTWPIQKTLVPGSFSYSILVKLSDGSVGDLFESDRNIRFARISLDWVISGSAR